MTVQIFVNIDGKTEVLIFEDDIKINMDEIIIFAFKKYFKRKNIILKDYIKSGNINFLKAGVFRVNNNKYRYGNNLYFDVSLLNNCTIRHNYTTGKDHYFTNEDVEKIMSVLS